MNNLSKVLIVIIAVLIIGFFTILGFYLNLKSKYNKLESDFLFSQDGEELENSGNFLFKEEGK
jgi:FtsZ-interacting cell division protein ZipA